MNILRGYKIPWEDGRKERFSYDNYGWTEHISRKWGQWFTSPQDLLEQMAKCGFHITEVGQKEV